MTAIPRGNFKHIERVTLEGNPVRAFTIPDVEVQRCGSLVFAANVFFKDLPPTYKPVFGPVPGVRQSVRVQSLTDQEITEYLVYNEVYCDGLAELGFLVHYGWFKSFDRPVSILYLDWLIGMFAHLCGWAIKIRKGQFIEQIEYAIEVEIVNTGNLKVYSHNSDDPVETAMLLPRMKHGRLGDPIKSNLFPFSRYSLGPEEEKDDLLKQFQRDYLNSLGLDSKCDDEELKIAIG